MTVLFFAAAREEAPSTGVRVRTWARVEGMGRAPSTRVRVRGDLGAGPGGPNPKPSP